MLACPTEGFELYCTGLCKVGIRTCPSNCKLQTGFLKVRAVSVVQVCRCAGVQVADGREPKLTPQVQHGNPGVASPLSGNSHHRCSCCSPGVDLRKRTLDHKRKDTGYAQARTRISSLSLSLSPSPHNTFWYVAGQFADYTVRATYYLSLLRGHDKAAIHILPCWRTLTGSLRIQGCYQFLLA